MRMAWWLFIILVSIQVILIQYMIESYLDGHFGTLPYYMGAMGFMFVVSWLSYAYFKKMERTPD